MPSDHRALLRHLLGRTSTLQVPGVYDGLTTLLVEQAGFECAFLSGAWTYTGALSGDHSSWRTNFWDGSGYEVVSGRFADSNTFTGKYRLYYPDGYLAAQADVALSRISAQTTALTAEADPAAAALMSNSLTESVRELIEGDDGPRP